MFEALGSNIETLIEPLLNELGVEIIELNIRKRNNTIYLQIIADKERGGITIEECSMINRGLADKLDGSSLIEEDYIIEVSSPGLDRPIKTKKDFMRAIGRYVNIFISEPSYQRGGQCKAIIKEVMEDNIMVIPIKEYKEGKRRKSGYKKDTIYYNNMLKYGKEIEIKEAAVAIPLNSIIKAEQII